ncbi:aminotransferase class IV [Hyalangium versicolor]|uniref:aminotransferase class IV n=1 Tax=Hyalangium versicolor TaxID=2861190 RepID=UPI001CC935FA|nr:aminotransferase class IV [Hyalangium versicolor]
MAVTAPRLWLEGALVDATDAKLPVMAHAAQRGSLVFDAGSFHPTPRGPALFRAREHIARFLRSARAVGLELSYGEEELLRASVEVVRATGRDEGLVRWSAFFTAGAPDLLPRSSRGHVAIAGQLLEEPGVPKPIRVATFPDARKAAPEALDPSVKVGAAYLGPMLHRRRAKAAGADDIVLLDREGHIAEAPVANVFAVVGGAVWTPPLRYVLAGITRDSVLALARAEGIPVREEPLPLETFRNADEVFLSGTSLPLAPISHVDGRALGPAPGPVTARLTQRFLAIHSGSDEAFREWLTYV